MDNIISRMFDSAQGNIIYKSASETLARYGMADKLHEGVLVGLSGGADSVMLLLYLCEYRRRNGTFPLIAVHINHMIRGDEALRDEEFCVSLCRSLGVELIVQHIDVPAIADKCGKGIEECARDARYSAFTGIISGRKEIKWVFTAHNIGDNAETVLLNILRGCGSRGGAGIPVLRDGIFRPLICCSKSDIVSALQSAGVEFVTDSTNLSVDYSRNYIRNKVLPTMSVLTPSPETMISRFASNLRSDDDFIRSVARDFLESHSVITNKDLLSLHSAVFSRVVSMMCDAAGASVTHKQINAIRENLSTGNFSLSVTGGSFVSEYSKCHIAVNDGINYEYRFEIMEGLNSLSGFDADFLLSRGDVDKSSLNVYKISIQANLRSAIIDGELYLRPKMDGDSVYYGGMSHKLKKLFNDRKIPPAIRPSIPILCDSRGVVWVPGFGVRDDGVSGEGNDLRVCLMIGKSDTLSEVRMRSGNEFKS